MNRIYLKRNINLSANNSLNLPWTNTKLPRPLHQKHKTIASVFKNYLPMNMVKFGDQLFYIYMYIQQGPPKLLHDGYTFLNRVLLFKNAGIDYFKK